jgi:hypothetical protein
VIAVLVARILLFAIGFFLHAARPAIRLCMSSEAFCSACCPCGSRRVSTIRRKSARFWQHQDLWAAVEPREVAWLMVFVHLPRSVASFDGSTSRPAKSELN